MSRALTLKDVVALAPVVGSTISPDGRWAAIIVPRYDARTQSRPQVLYVADLDGDRAWRALGEVDATFHDPVFAEDGRLAVFRTHGEISDIAVFDPAEPARPAVDVVAMPPGAVSLAWTGAPARLSCIGFDGPRVRRVWLWDDLTARPRVVSPPKLRVGDHAFARQGDQLAFLHAPARVVGGSEPATTLYWTPSLGRKPVAVPLEESLLGHLAWSVDGRWLAGLGRPLDAPLTAPRLWLVDPRQGTARRLLADVDGWITGLDWSPDGTLSVALEQGVVGRVLSVPVQGPATLRGPDETMVSGVRHAKTRDRTLLVRQDLDEPQHLRMLDDGRDVRLTTFDDRLRDVRLVPASTERWSAPDGLDIEGLFLRPDGTPPPPLLVWLHGGPAEHLQRTFSAYFQLFAAQGWAVLAPNYRGSTGRSDAFLQALVGGLCEADVGDVLAGVEALGDRVDRRRVAFVGWSYGGALALTCATARPGTRAVVAGAPVADWLTVFGAASWPWLTRRYFPSEPWVDPAPYDRASPVRRLDRLTAPTLFLHGEDDDRVPVSHSRLMYRLLQARQVPTDLRLFPDQGHVFHAPWAVSEMLARTVTWLKTWLDPVT